MPREHLLKIGVSGIRGVVGEFLTPQLACAFGQAFGTYVGRGRVVLGRDTRSTGEMLQHAVQCGLLSTGCEPVDVGVLPTPTIQTFVNATGARGGIAITASHNPPEYNALKLFNADGLFFNNYERGELIDLYHQGVFVEVPNDEIRHVSCEPESPERLHFERVLRHVDAGRIRAQRFRVALDAVNGAGSLLSPRFLTRHLGCELRAISIDPQQPFPREAEPVASALGDLARLTASSGAAIGFAQDPDGDRLAVVDEQGRVLDNDDVLALVVDAALEYVTGDVVVNLTTSAVIEDVAERHNRRVHRTPVGEANVVEMMQAVRAAIGGEGSNGGVIFPAVHYCRDSYTAMAFLLDRMAATGKTASELASSLPRYYRRSSKAAFAHGRLGGLMQSLEEAYPDAELDRRDGLKLVWPGRWLHVRASNTEPLLRYNVEARTEEDLEKLYGEADALLNATV